MKSVNIVLNVNELSVSELTVFCESVQLKMTGNDNFTNPNPPLSELKLSNEALKTALANLILGNKASSSAVSSKRKAVERVLKLLAAYVEYTANGDESIALSSGFETKKSASRKSKDFNAKQGTNSGEVDLITKSERNSAYVWQYSLDPLTDQSPWTQASITMSCKNTIVGLLAGQKYWFRVGIVNKDGQQPFSDPYFVHVV